MTLKDTDLRNLQVGCKSNSVGTRLYNTINTLEDKADTITVETASAGAKIELPEATANGTDKVILQAPADLTTDRTITIPDADVDLTYLDQDVGVGASPSLAKVTVTDTAGAAVGTVTAEEQGTAGRKVVLTFSNETVAVLDAPGTTGYLGLKIFDLPDGLINFQGATANLAITKDSAGVDDDWNGDFGVGTVTAIGTTPLATTEQDLIPTTATPQALAGATTAKGASTDTEANIIHDGTSTAIDVYLNILVDDADQDVTSTPCNFILNGTITLCYTQCGDF